jgi:AcrR family transcriptional regulator
VLDALADHLLAEGLAGARLRPMAAAAGTSDRMLLYYFADRDDVLRATLRHLAVRLAALLDDATAEGAVQSTGALIRQLWAATHAPALQPYVRLWIELGARAGRGEEPYRAVAGEIADLFHDWVAARLSGPASARAAQAALVLAVVDGAALLESAGRGALAAAAIDAVSDMRSDRRRASTR